MKMHPMLAISILLICSLTMQAKEKPWTPDIDYNVSRRLSVGDPIKSPWSFSAEAQRAEYRMLYLLQAHKDAILLALSFERKVGEGKITQEQIVKLRQVGGNLNDVVRCSYTDVTPYFSTNNNPTLLLMMLYHFEVYCYGGDSDESWPTIIKPLQELDPEITAKAMELAKKGTAERNKITEKAEQAADGDAE